MKQVNEMRLVFESRSINESFARTSVAAFAACLDPTVEQIGDIKTAVSEAVTNCIVHAYPDSIGNITLSVQIHSDGWLKLRVRDNGVGIADVKKAMTPLFTTKGGERAGLGFAVMESFMDSIKVSSMPGKGTTVTMTKKLGTDA